jgi:hypothetical protein
MEPLIRAHDQLLVSPDLSALRRGSIVVFLQDDRLVAHRLLRVIPGPPDQVVTKGDNAWRFDPPVGAEDILGHVLAIRRDDQLLVLDSRRGRAMGWTVAAFGLALTMPYAWARGLKQRLWGVAPLRRANLAKYCGRMLSRALLAALTCVMGRKTGSRD